MTLTRIARWLAFGLAAGAAWIGLSTPAQAIPVFARQTGHNCAACHISFPELTAYGREFKLNGYTFGEAQPVPLAFAVMASYTTVSDKTDHSPYAGGANNCDGCDVAHIDQMSLFFGGKIAENIGMFGQYSVSHNGNDTYSGAEDNTEVRFVHRFAAGSSLEDDSVIGLDINNNLTMQDVWNAVPQWRYPWFPESRGGFGPVPGPFIDGNDTAGTIGPQRAVGIGVYGWFQKTWYAELSLYIKPWGSFSWLVNGSGNTQYAVSQPSDVLDGAAPYYRLAYSKDWGYNSVEVGLFGISAKTYWDANYNNALGAPGDTITAGNATNQYHDLGIDFQYQYNRSEPWIFSGAGSWIHESSTQSANQLNGISSNSDNSINEYNIKGTLYYERVYGVSLGYSAINGSTDQLLYGSGASGGTPSPSLCGGPTPCSGLSGSGSPNSAWWTLELNYVPIQNMRFTLQYTAYTKLNGGNNNFDGLGNNASGQNTLYGAIWWAF